MSNYVYIKAKPELWTVGFYMPNGGWVSESDHDNPDDAARRVALLNGEGSRSFDEWIFTHFREHPDPISIAKYRMGWNASLNALRNFPDEMIDRTIGSPFGLEGIAGMRQGMEVCAERLRIRIERMLGD